MRKSWVVALATFVGVLAFGGLAFAAVGVVESREAAEADEADVASDSYLLDLLENEVNKQEELKSDLPPVDKKEEKVVDEKPVEKAKEHDEKPADEAKDEKPADEKPKEEKPSDEVAPKPELAITFPEDGAHFSSSKVTFKGEATPGSSVFAGDYKAEMDAEGNWAIGLILSPGANKTVFVAKSDGGVADAAIVVYLDVEEKKEEEKSDYVLEAHQAFGTCEEEVPYDVFWGSTAPGAEVIAISEFGSGETVANEHGEFEFRVEFPKAPYGKTFTVWIKSIGQKQVFEFTSYSQPPSEHVLEAHIVSEVSDSEVPRAVFWGFTAPNAEVLAWSEYGTVATTANGEGGFEFVAEFPEAPHGQTFVIYIKSIEQKKGFEFTSVYEGGV